MDWDDEDEATHIFDKDEGHLLPPAKNAAAPAPPPPAGAASNLANLAPRKATLLGLTPPPSGAMHVPPPPAMPSARPAPPPAAAPFFGVAGAPPPPVPPPPTASFARASGTASAAPPPPPATPASAFSPASVPFPKPPGLPKSFGPPGMPAPAASTPSLNQPGTPPRSMEATAVLRPAGARLPVILGAALVGVLVIAGVYFVAMPKTGRLAINVSDAKGAGVNHVDIFVDGKKWCETTPCIQELAKGLHEVKVLADGYEAPAVQAVAVEAGKDATATFTLSASAKGGTGFKIEGSQAGAKLYIDGKEIGPLPQEVRDLTPGDHLVRVAASERYAPIEKHVTVEANVVADLGPITLKVLKGKATINLGTAGANVYLVSGSDRRELRSLPISVDIDTAKAWSLQASKPGYSDYSQAITFDDGQAEKSFTVSLDPKGSATPAVGYGGGGGGGGGSVAIAQPPATTDNGGGGGGGGGGGEGFLNINSIPPSTCFLDGKSLGTTPKVHVSVSAGSHTVKFVDADDGLTKTISVKVGAGETKPAVAKLN
jgi:serine/threonine-protein kinase